MLALGCDHGGYELMQEVRLIWISRESPTEILDATARRRWTIRFMPKR